NAKRTRIDPYGAVVAEGTRQIQPEQATVYTLTAENSYASRGVQLGVSVKPARASPQRPNEMGKSRHVARGPAFPKHQAMVIQARDCRLTKAVVVRGDGWLQGETDTEGLKIAACDVNFARSGMYELFVRYASD